MYMYNMYMYLHTHVHVHRLDKSTLALPLHYLGPLDSELSTDLLRRCLHESLRVGECSLVLVEGTHRAAKLRLCVSELLLVLLFHCVYSVGHVLAVCALLLEVHLVCRRLGGKGGREGREGGRERGRGEREGGRGGEGGRKGKGKGGKKREMEGGRDGERDKVTFREKGKRFGLEYIMKEPIHGEEKGPNLQLLQLQVFQ